MKSLIIVLFSFATESQSLAQTLNPGMWKSEARFKLNGIPMPSKSDSNCVTAKETKSPKKTIEEALKRNDCQLTKWDLKKNNVIALVKCKNDQYEAEGRIKGTFEKKSYALEGNIEGKHKIIGRAKADVILTGQWTGDCTAKN